MCQGQKSNSVLKYNYNAAIPTATMQNHLQDTNFRKFKG